MGAPKKLENDYQSSTPLSMRRCASLDAANGTMWRTGVNLFDFVTRRSR
jgi:hypothetical protein